MPGEGHLLGVMPENALQVLLFQEGFSSLPGNRYL
jgi:hypothetical protein